MCIGPSRLCVLAFDVFCVRADLVEYACNGMYFYPCACRAPGGGATWVLDKLAANAATPSDRSCLVLSCFSSYYRVSFLSFFLNCFILFGVRAHKGNTAEELPEVALAGVRINHLDLLTAKHLDVTQEIDAEPPWTSQGPIRRSNTKN